MSNKTNDGGPAFPRKRSLHRRDAVDMSGAPNSDYVQDPPQDGMSLRDWFAGQALPAIINGNTEFCKLGGKATALDSIATDCYKLADAMLAAREAK